MSLVTGFRIVCAFSIVLALLVMSGTGWIFHTSSEDSLQKFNVTLQTSYARESPVAGTVTVTPHHRDRQRVSGKPLHGKFHRERHGQGGSAKRVHIFENEYKSLKEDLLHDWEHDGKPTLIACCIVICACACLQCIGSLAGALGCCQVKTRVKFWLILHFILFFVHILCVMTMFVSKMNRGPSEKWNVKIMRMQAASNRAKVARIGPGHAGGSLDHDPEVQAISQYIKFSSSLFYIIATTNASLVLLLFFGLIWLMKEDRGHKYQKVGTLM